MRKKFGNGSKLTKAQKTLPDFLKKKIIALVCCRQNSKGIKNKNIKLLKGKPLLYWTAKNIIKSNIFNKMHLSAHYVCLGQ